MFPSQPLNNLTDEAIRKMSPAEADAYAEKHPDEALHIAKVFAVSAAKQTKKSIGGLLKTKEEPN